MTLRELFCSIEKNTVISLSGGGGKTSTLFQLAEFLKDSKVLVTTTTKILKPEPSDLYDIVVKKNSEDFLEHIKKNHCKNVIVYGSTYDEKTKKLGSCSKSFIKEVKSYFDYILIEADGASQKPIKAPGAHEPVISELTTLYIGVIGLDCLGNIADETNVHRAELFSLIRNKNEEELITGEDLINLINSPCGLFKNAPENCKRVLLLNKTDLIEKGTALKLLVEINKGANFPLGIVLNSYKESSGLK